jgi:hypothetical protein
MVLHITFQNDFKVHSDSGQREIGKQEIMHLFIS